MIYAALLPSMLVGAALQTSLTTTCRTPGCARASIVMVEQSDALAKLREQNRQLEAMAQGLSGMVEPVPGQYRPPSQYQTPPPNFGGAPPPNYGAPDALQNALQGGEGSGADRGRLAAAAGLLGAIALSQTVDFGGLLGLGGSPSANDPAASRLKGMAASGGLGNSQEAALSKLYPRNLGSKEMDALVAKTLYGRGYTPQNTLFATSTCPDEVNYKEGDMLNLMTNRWGESFSLGGLGGVPFVGKAGFGAYAHHAPDKDGKMLIVFAPHVGVEYDGKVGALRRANQDGVSTACGAAIGAYNAIMKEAIDGKPPPAPETLPSSTYFDAQIKFIIDELRPRLAGIENAADPMAFVSYQMYILCREFFIDNVLGASLWDEAKQLTVLGGIQINVNGGDRFLPLMFQERTDEPGSVVDLYEETFGPEPNLSKVLGSREKNLDVFEYDIDTPAPRPPKGSVKGYA